MADPARVAVYRPAYVQDGRRVAGPDEDPFTLAATALEQVVPRSAPPASARLHLVGEFPAVADWGFAALTGSTVDVERHPGGTDGLGEALESVASAGSEGARWLVAADLSPAGDVASFALALGPGERLDGPLRTGLTGGPGATGGAVSLAAAGPEDGSGSPRPLPPGDLGRFAQADVNAVSEGAYVPRARYLENLPSRWRLLGVRCGRCGAVTFPSRPSCRSCGARDELTPEVLPRDGGTVVAATTIGPGGQPTEFDPQVAALGEFGVVLVELAPGVRLTLQVTDTGPAELPIGSRVRTRLRRLYPMEGEWRYGRKATPFGARDPVGAP